ncbi:hypothetical protein ASG49_14550 [Marmoricola sp. Leaf446]|uniref:amino acid--[acyl-carrier-protein] ligase n=1 Tax=Marmoricola sp. Leaf446 TaxID=1736379 RepID=UPI0006FC443E|nr:amino acid--[acyl-carrier-protein] ligase [Marmoricola sp. Leaf446]KQT90928.1 hypothetical protein ASG49_14550 [Marmoricola sp. Leaf446]
MSAGGSLVGAALKGALLADGILVESGVPGLYQRSEVFESVVRGVESAARSAARYVGGFEPLRFLPPIMPRETFVKTGYLRSFPDLIGSVETFEGGDAEHAALLRTADAGGDWTQALSPSEVTLCSAACHSLYPHLAGTLGAGGRYLELQGFCFRHEPSPDPVRMQSFRMHELVHVGTPSSAVAHRDAWLERGLRTLRDLGLPVEPVVANDPFFGRAGRMLAANQRATELKYEIVCAVTSTEKPTAIASANYHEDHFGSPFGILAEDGSPAHSACFGFGLERVALALFAVHGLHPGGWPAEVRDRLRP